LQDEPSQVALELKAYNNTVPFAIVVFIRL